MRTDLPKKVKKAKVMQRGIKVKIIFSFLSLFVVITPQITEIVDILREHAQAADFRRSRVSIFCAQVA